MQGRSPIKSRTALTVMHVLFISSCITPTISTVGGGVPLGNGAFAFPPFAFPFGMELEEEREDPERAKRLVDGLEEVPGGLIKRMQRVGGPGTSCGEVPNCAVCWESLLESKDEFEGNADQSKAQADQLVDGASQQGDEQTMEAGGSAAASSSSNQPSSSDSPLSTTEVESAGESRLPKVVVLPCSHAFHALCLLPWFSKPGRTTCPSCRFDIDPDSLTYRPRPIRPRAPPQPAQPHAAGAAADAHEQLPFLLNQIFGAPPPPAPVPPAAPQSSPGASAAPSANAESHLPNVQQEPGQQQLPSFITFDINMIIPVHRRGRNAAAPGAGGATAQAAPPDANSGRPVFGPPPPPLQPQLRTDHSGLPFDDSLLRGAITETFEQMLGIPMPRDMVFQSVGPEGAAPPDNAQQWYTFTAPGPGVPLPPLNMPGIPHGVPPRRPAEKRQWTPPPAPGPTLRQIVERNERRMGLRCSDVSCGIGPSDDDPASTIDFVALRQITISPLKSDTSRKESVCDHRFHPACLVSAERVAGWGHEVETGEPAGEDASIEVPCPVCRAVGVISRTEWEAGACALARMLV